MAARAVGRCYVAGRAGVVAGRAGRHSRLIEPSRTGTNCSIVGPRGRAAGTVIRRNVAGQAGVAADGARSRVCIVVSARTWAGRPGLGSGRWAGGALSGRSGAR